MAVTALEIRIRQPLAGGREFGSVGHYIQLDGTAHFAVDPAHPLNSCITDIQLAPRNGDGRVHFSADIRILTPEDSRRGNHRLLSMCRTAAIVWRWRRSTVSRGRSTQMRRPMQAMVS